MHKLFYLSKDIWTIVYWRIIDKLYTNFFLKDNVMDSISKVEMRSRVIIKKYKLIY